MLGGGPARRPEPRAPAIQVTIAGAAVGHYLLAAVSLPPDPDPSMRLPRLVLPLCLGLALPAAAIAQSPAQPAQPAPAAQPAWTGDLPKHFEGITLSDAQRTRIAALQQAHHARMDALRDSAKAAGAATTGNAPLTARIQAVMAEEHAAFRAVLTDDASRRRFDENMAHMHGPAHGSGHGAGHAGRPPTR